MAIEESGGSSRARESPSRWMWCVLEVDGREGAKTSVFRYLNFRQIMEILVDILK